MESGQFPSKDSNNNALTSPQLIVLYIIVLFTLASVIYFFTVLDRSNVIRRNFTTSDILKKEILKFSIPRNSSSIVVMEILAYQENFSKSGYYVVSNGFYNNNGTILDQRTITQGEDTSQITAPTFSYTLEENAVKILLKPTDSTTTIWNILLRIHD